MNEKTLAKYISSGLRGLGSHAHVQRHEDVASVGIPDLSLGAFGRTAWVELKRIAAWPRRPDTKVKIKTFMPMQLRWLQARGRAAGGCFMLLKVEDTKEYLLISYENLELIQKALLIPSQIKDLAIGHWTNRIDFARLGDVLTGTEV